MLFKFKLCRKARSRFPIKVLLNKFEAIVIVINIINDVTVKKKTGRH
jgi:hypothetical protein